MTNEPALPGAVPISTSKKISIWISVGLIKAFLLLCSIYAVWGWITVSDIRSKCEKKGYDFDTVMSSMITPPLDLQSLTNALITGTPPAHVSAFPELSRLSVSFIQYGGEWEHTTTTNGSNRNILRLGTAATGGLIEPFAFMSDNFLNFIFCLGIGYLMSLTLLLLKFLRQDTLSIRFILLRPIAGALVGGCLFILVLSGGALFWTNTAHVSGLSIGVLAAFGAVYCERFERVLKKGFARNEPSPETR